MAFRFSFLRQGALPKKPTRRRTKVKKEVPLTRYQKQQALERKQKSERNKKKKLLDNQRRQKERYNSFVRLNNDIMEHRMDPRSVSPGPHTSPRDFNVPVRGELIPGRYDIPEAHDRKGWDNLFDDIDGTYRFGSPVLASSTSVDTPNEHEIRDTRRKQTRKALRDARMQFDPGSGKLSPFTRKNLAIVNPRTKQEHHYRDIVVWNKPRKAHREFPSLDQYVKQDTDHLITDREGNLHSLSTLARNAHLQDRPTGYYWRGVHERPRVEFTPDQWIEQPTVTPKGTPTTRTLMRKGYSTVDFTVHNFSNPQSASSPDNAHLVIPDSELPNPHEHGVEGARALLDRLKAPFSVEDYFKTPLYKHEFIDPEEKELLIADGVDPATNKTRFRTVPNTGRRETPRRWAPNTVDVNFKSSVSADNQLKLQDWQQAIGGVTSPEELRRQEQGVNSERDRKITPYEEVSRTRLEPNNIQKGTIGDFDIVWQNEHGQKRNLASYMRHIGDEDHDGISNFPEPAPRDASTIKTHLDPTTASREEVEDLLHQHLSGDLDKYKSPHTDSMLDSIRETTANLGDRPTIPNLDNLNLDGHLVDYNLNGKPVRNSLSRFLEHHYAGGAQKNPDNESGLSMVNPAYSKIGDLDAIINHATNGEVTNARDYTRLYLRKSPERHKAVDIGRDGDIRPTRTKQWGVNTLYTPTRDDNTFATRNLNEVYESMGGSNLYTSQGLIPKMTDENLDRLVHLSTKGEYSTAKDYDQALGDAVENGGNLTPFLDHHVLLDKNNKIVPMRNKPLARRRKKDVTYKSDDGRVIKTVSAVDDDDVATRLNDRRVPRSATQAVPLATYFRPALVGRDSRLQYHYLPERAPEHIPVHTPDFGQVESELAPPTHSSIESDAAGIPNFGKPIIDSARGAVVGLDRHNRSNGRENPLWVTSDEEHSCPQCAATLCKKCRRQVARNKIDPKTNEHKPGFQDECLKFLNQDSDFVDNP